MQQSKRIGEDLFEKAMQQINSVKQDEYGAPEDSFADIAERWNQHVCHALRKFLKEHKISPVEGIVEELLFTLDKEFLLMPSNVALMLEDMKTARELHKHKQDNIVDKAGYLALYLKLLLGELANNIGYEEVVPDTCFGECEEKTYMECRCCQVRLDGACLVPIDNEVSECVRYKAVVISQETQEDNENNQVGYYDTEGNWHYDGDKVSDDFVEDSIQEFESGVKNPGLGSLKVFEDYCLALLNRGIPIVQCLDECKTLTAEAIQAYLWNYLFGIDLAEVPNEVHLMLVEYGLIENGEKTDRLIWWLDKEIRKNKEA